jgi:hypothetical protein
MSSSKMEIEIADYFRSHSLHDHIVERIDVLECLGNKPTCICICREWDDISGSHKRIRITFEKYIVTGDFDIEFDIYSAVAEVSGDSVTVRFTECSTGLDTVFTCSRASVIEL